MSVFNKVLVLYAHPSPHRSEINRPLFTLAQSVEGVTAVDLYAEYPNLRIHVDKEQRRLIAHDVIIFLFPIYWYSTPAILKEWQDLVLEHGFAYGTGGDALKAKTFFCAVSAKGSEAAYGQEGANHFSLRELLRPLEQTASLTGMHYLPPFVLFRSRSAIEEKRLDSHLDDFKQLLNACVAGVVAIEKVAHLSTLNEGMGETEEPWV